jgi:protein-disulfide isomerase
LLTIFINFSLALFFKLAFDAGFRVCCMHCFCKEPPMAILRSAFARLTLASVLALPLSSLALSQTAPAPAPAAPKAKPAPKSAAQVVITNARTVKVLSVTIADAEGKVAAKLTKALDAGKTITLKLPPKAGCQFVINASFEDEAVFDETSLDLCADKIVKFTE